MITCICWIRRSRAIKVPDRPTPALQWTTIGLWSVETRSRKDLTNRMSVVGGSGTPKSGHVLKWKWRMIRLDSPYNEIKTNSLDEKRHKKHSFNFFCSYPTDTEFGNGPVCVVTFIQDGYLCIDNQMIRNCWTIFRRFIPLLLECLRNKLVECRRANNGRISHDPFPHNASASQLHVYLTPKSFARNRPE